MSTQQDYERAAEKYASWVEEYDSPRDFYTALRKDGVSNAISCFLLRDFYDLGIHEYLAIANQFNQSTQGNS